MRLIPWGKVAQHQRSWIMSEPEQLDLLDWLAALPPNLPPTAPELAPAFPGRSPDPSPSPVHLTRVDLSCNMRRFYSLALATSLFGEWGVRRQWGRIGAPGRERTDWYSKAQEAEGAFQAMLRAKRRRGYASS